MGAEYITQCVGLAWLVDPLAGQSDRLGDYGAGRGGGDGGYSAGVGVSLVFRVPVRQVNGRSYNILFSNSFRIFRKIIDPKKENF